jgi:hypothetical protein
MNDPSLQDGGWRGGLEHNVSDRMGDSGAIPEPPIVTETLRV